MFDKRKYTIKFKKAYIPTDWGSWKEVADSHLLMCLMELQQKYDFEIVCTKFKDCFDESKITIKCNKENKLKIFRDYVMLLGYYIEEVRF